MSDRETKTEQTGKPSENEATVSEPLHQTAKNAATVSQSAEKDEGMSEYGENATTVSQSAEKDGGMSEYAENAATVSDHAENAGGMSEPFGRATPNRASAKTKRRKIWAAILAAVLFSVGLLAGWAVGASSVDSRARNLAWLAERVADNYYREVDDDALYEKFFESLQLDQFCTYYTPAEFERLVDESEGRNEGYGVSLIEEDGKILVFRTVYNSPAELAGLEGGMTVYRYGAGEDSLTEGTFDGFYDYLTSHDSCAVEFGYDGGEKRVAVIGRASYAAAYCEYRDGEGSFRFRGKSGELVQVGGGMAGLAADQAYVRLTEFDGNAAAEFETCLKQMKARGKNRLVLDLRSNGGGYLTTLCSIAAHLLKNAEGNRPLVATARYRSGKTEEYRADGNDYGTYFSGGVIVLADENTASASESLIGAMLDYGTVSPSDVYIRVSGTGGEETARTFGKGVMQNTFVAPDGRALRLTVAEIFWPKGNSIHGTGIVATGENAVRAALTASAEEFLRNL